MSRPAKSSSCAVLTIQRREEEQLQTVAGKTHDPLHEVVPGKVRPLVGGEDLAGARAAACDGEHHDVAPFRLAQAPKW